MGIVITYTYTTPGAYTVTVPPGLVGVELYCWGGGGCGGARLSSAGYGGGGKGGGYAGVRRGTDENGNLIGAALPSVINFGNNIQASVGGGGTSAGFTYGSPSTIVEEKSTVLCRAPGGYGVEVNTAAGATLEIGTPAIGDTTYSGGNGATGSAIISGGGGGGEGACTTGNGNAATTRLGGTGCDGGDGGNGRSNASQGAGSNGTQTGGGGGGAYSSGGTYAGGNGGDGKIIIRFYVQNAILAPIDEFL